MALHTSQSNQSNPSDQSTQQAQAPRAQTQYANMGSPLFGLSSQLSGMGSGGESYEKLFSKIQTQVKRLNEEQKTEEKYGVYKLLKNTAGLNYSGIIVTESLGGMTAAHVLMVEKTGNYPDKVIENVNNVRYEILRTPGEALDPKYIAQTQATVSNLLKIPANSVVVADGTLVPNEFDVENDGQVSELISNTLNATHVEIATRVLDYKGNDLQSLAAQYKNGKFVINLHFNSEETVYFDQTGMPVRQDVCVALSFKTNNSNQNNRSINQGDDTIEIVRTYGYVDFEFVGSTMINGMMSTQKFLPNFIITHIEAPTVAPTPDIVMLGVASVLALSEDMNWMQAFRPTAARKNEVDFNDIGALNIEGNIEQSPTGFGKKYDTKSKTATVMELNKLIQTLVQPMMMVSIDVPKAGPETWYTSAFQHILVHKNADALKRVHDFMVFSTGGAYHPQQEPMFADITNKIHGGFYKSKDGYRDLRNLSCYLAVANYVSETGQQPAVVSQYTNTLYSNNIPTVLRAATRRTYLDEMSNRSAQVKQMFDRMTFNSNFLSNWVRSLRSVGFDPVFSNAGGVNDMFVKRNTANFQTAMIGQDVRLMSSVNNMPGNWTQYGDYNRQF